MTTTDFRDDPLTRNRMLRRSRTDRLGAGVAGGLGTYFDVDPVLFRVLFATAAFFGGAGLLAYLLAWAAIPDEGTASAPIDSWIRGLRERRVPFVLVAIVGAVLLWAIAFSWWAPRPSFLVVVIVIVLVAIFGRRRGPGSELPAEPTSTYPTATFTAADVASSYGVDLTKTETDMTATVPTAPVAASIAPPVAPPAAQPSDQRQAPEWVRDMRRWAEESREQSRQRRRRAAPLRITGLILVAVALTILGLIDAASGIAIPVYFWVILAIVGATLLVGLAARRTPWSLVWLLVPAVVGVIGFGDTHASLHDGIGQKAWRPTANATSSHYKLAFGQAALDLTGLPTPTSPETIDVTMASGQVRVILPPTLNIAVRAEIHIGQLTLNGNAVDSDGLGSGGMNLDRTVATEGRSGAPVLVRVHLADGNVDIQQR